MEPFEVGLSLALDDGVLEEMERAQQRINTLERAAGQGSVPMQVLRDVALPPRGPEVRASRGKSEAKADTVIPPGEAAIRSMEPATPEEGTDNSPDTASVATTRSTGGDGRPTLPRVIVLPSKSQPVAVSAALSRKTKPTSTNPGTPPCQNVARRTIVGEQSPSANGLFGRSVSAGSQAESESLVAGYDDSSASAPTPTSALGSRSARALIGAPVAVATPAPAPADPRVSSPNASGPTVLSGTSPGYAAPAAQVARLQPAEQSMGNAAYDNAVDVPQAAAPIPNGALRGPPREREAYLDSLPSPAGVGSMAGSSAPPAVAVPESSASSSKEDKAGRSQGQSMSGDVYLDGVMVGRWMSKLLGREAERASAGPTAYDGRRGRLLPGPTVR